MSAGKLITDHIDLWSATVKAKSTQGRGSSKKHELYGIKKLRELILELAVRGKLVPQDPNDEPASVLLERISAEKAQLIKDKKIKKQKPLLEVNDNELPFDIPKGWEFVRLGRIGNIFNGNSVNARTKEELYTNTEGLPFIATKDVGYGFESLGYFNGVCIPPDEPKFKVAKKGAVLICAEGGSAGKKCGIAEMDVCFGNKLFANELFGGISPVYLLSNFLTKTFYDQFSASMTGIIGGISASKFAELIIPVPPVSEQVRIDLKVEELMALCDQLEQQTETSLDAHNLLVDTLLATLTDAQDAAELSDNWARLAEHFDTLITTDYAVEQLKQTILQLAVQGKLVPQDPNDEPASALIERLEEARDEWLKENLSDNPECSTMLKKLKKLQTPEPPFPIPNSWRCIHLIQLAQLLVDCHNKTAPYADEGIPIIRTTNIRNRRFNLNGVKYVTEETYEYWSRRCPPLPRDIMFTREAPMGEAAIIPEGKRWCLGQRTMLIRPMHEFVSEGYLLLALTEPGMLRRASANAVGATVKHLRVGDVENLKIQLPPIEEQYRIVAKVDELMALCDQLKTNLQQAQTTQLHIADAITEQALA